MIAYWKNYNNDVYELLKLYAYNRFLAMAPYARTGNASEGYKYKIRPIDTTQILILFLHTCTYIGTSVTIIITRQDNIFTNSKITDYLAFTCYLLILARGITFMACFQFRQKEFFRCLEIVDALDKSFVTYGLNLNYKYVYKAHLYFLGGFFFACTVNITYYFAILHRSFLTELPIAMGFLPTFVANFTCYFYFMFLVIVMYLRYQHVHEILKSLKLMNLSSNKERIIRIIYDVSKVHSKLHAIVRNLNKVFEIPLFVNACSVFYLTTFCTLSNDYMPHDRAAELFYFTTFDVILFSAATITCVSAKYQCEKTGRILCEIEVMYYDYDVAEKKMGLLLQLLHENVDFTAAGLFPIDLELPFKYFSGLTMIVMFIQNVKMWITKPIK